MRKVTRINDNWIFKTEGREEVVTFPHCFNAADGLTRDYKRTRCIYKKELPPMKNNIFLCIEGANSVCDVAVDSKIINSHRGGYSSFATDLTPYIKNGCTLELFVDNSDFEDVYPSTADFTFWGGIYRNVSLIETSDTHFSFSDFSSDGVYATPKKVDDKWVLDVKCVIDNFSSSAMLRCTLLDNENNVFARGESKSNEMTLKCDNPILWNGLKNPYLYTLQCEIVEKGVILDNVSVKVGFRSFYIDSEKGFFLNGEHLKLKGVSRHQDRENMGNAITEKEHSEDLDLILEVGANSVRLAHYQQNRYFYDLCDEKGVLVWAESPIISCFSELKQENAKQQLTELVKQNYNHPSIFCWGIENETHRIVGFDLPDGRRAYAAWAVEEPVSVPLPEGLEGKAIAVYDIYGNPIVPESPDRLALTESPMRCADMMLKNSRAKAYAIKLRCPSCLIGCEGYRADLRDSSVSAEKDLYISAVHYRMTADGAYTDVTLKRRNSDVDQ